MSSAHEIIIFYKYVHLADPAAVMHWLQVLCAKLGLHGRILLAQEGINGTVEGPAEQVRAFESAMHARPEFSDVWFKSSPGTGHAFPKMKIKVRSEIVTTGLSPETDINPNQVTGTHLSPAELKHWYESGQDFAIIDMRNDYEYAVGHFQGSLESGMTNFRDLPHIPEKFAHLKDKKVLTVCTYGVRCEKASGFLKEQGFQDVYQLDGGIGTYMKAYPGQDFLGSLYVFDDRMTEQFTDQYEKIGRCVACHGTSERFGNCAYDECHKQLIICETCAPQASTIFCQEACQLTRAALASK